MRITESLVVEDETKLSITLTLSRRKSFKQQIIRTIDDKIKRIHSVEQYL